MKIKEITLTKGFKVSVGYQVVQDAISITVEVEEGETPEEVYEKAKAWISERLKEEAKKAIKNAKQLKDFAEAEVLR